MSVFRDKELNSDFTLVSLDQYLGVRRSLWFLVTLFIRVKTLHPWLTYPQSTQLITVFGFGQISLFKFILRITTWFVTDLSKWLTSVVVYIFVLTYFLSFSLTLGCISHNSRWRKGDLVSQTRIPKSCHRHLSLKWDTYSRFFFGQCSDTLRIRFRLSTR